MFKRLLFDVVLVIFCCKNLSFTPIGGHLGRFGSQSQMMPEDFFADLMDLLLVV